MASEEPDGKFFDRSFENFMKKASKNGHFRALVNRDLYSGDPPIRDN